MKALFDYEMTGVLLGFDEELQRESSAQIQELMEMEIPASTVAFERPELEITGMSAAVYDGSVRLEPVLAADAPEASLSVTLPEAMIAPQLSGEAPTVSLKAELPELPSQICPTLDRSRLDPTAISQETAALCKMPKAASLDKPRADLGDLRKTVRISGSVPTGIKRIRNVLAHSNASAMRTALPATAIRTDFSLDHRMESVHLQVNMPGVAKGFTSPALHAEAKNSVPDAVKALRTEPVRLAEAGKGFVIDRNALPAVGSVAPTSASHDLKAGAEDVHIQVKTDGINGIAGFAQPMAAPTVSSQVVYPEIPEKPDFSEYYKSILDSARSES